VASPEVYEEFTRLREALARATSQRILTGRELIRNRDHVREERIATMVEPLDRLLGGGLVKGRLVEISGWRSTGRLSVVLATLAAVTSTGDAAALVDLGDGLDPESAALAGVDLARLLWIRPQTSKHAVMAAEMVVATGFPLVVVDMGMRSRGRRVVDAGWIRLARAAEGNETALVVSTPWPMSGLAAEARVEMRSRRATWLGTGVSPRVLAGITSRMTVGKWRGERAGSEEIVGWRT